jgi:hypothetical protein
MFLPRNGILSVEAWRWTQSFFNMAIGHLLSGRNFLRCCHIMPRGLEYPIENGELGNASVGSGSTSLGKPLIGSGNWFMLSRMARMVDIM